MSQMSFFVINTSVVNIYGAPDFNSPVVTQALLGESCRIIKEQDQWIKIHQWDDYEGWVNRFHGIFSDQTYQASFTMQDLHGVVRSTVDETVIRNLTFGDRLDASPNGAGYQVVLPDGCKGWTDARLSSGNPSISRNAIVKQAKKFLGAPYVWGGKSPNGFDCSGFVQTVFRAVGISLPRDAWQQAEYTKQYEIPVDNALPGDLFFFGESEKITHVAISTGDRGIIHAQGWVKEESLNPVSEHYNEQLQQILKRANSVPPVKIL